MDQKTYQALKNEIKQEVLAEIRAEFKGIKFDFTAYKNEVVSDDLAKAKKVLALQKWYWHIPIIGFFIYIMVYNRDLSNIDRGVLRKEINSQNMYFALIMIIIIFPSYFLPSLFIFFSKFILWRAINKVELKLKKESYKNLA